MELTLLNESLAVCRLPPGAEAPAWLDLDQGPLVSLTHAPGETSIVCPAARVPPAVRAERNWRALQVAGPLDFGAIGILAGLSAALAAAEVSIFALSTYDTDYLLVPEAQLTPALAALRAAGHRISEP